MATLRLLLGEHRRLARAAMEAAINAEEDMSVVAVAGSAPEVHRALFRTAVDVAVLDARLTPTGAVDVVTEIRDSHPDLAIVVLSDSEDHDLLYSAVHAGANGYVTRDRSLDTVMDSIRRVHLGETVIPALMLRALLDRMIHGERRRQEAAERFRTLTKREREVLQLLTEGSDHAEVAEILVISPETARTHIQNAIKKLGVHSRVEAVALALNVRWSTDGSGAPSVNGRDHGGAKDRRHGQLFGA